MNLHQEFVSLNFQIIGMKNRLMSKERVQKALRTLKNTENTPMVRAKIKTCGLDKVAPHCGAKLATPENQHIYAEHVENMSTSALQAFTKEIRHGKPEASKMTIELDEEMQILFNQLKKIYAKNFSNQEALKIILKNVFEDVSEDAFKNVAESAFSETSQANLTKKSDTPSLPSRTTSARKRREVTAKTNGKCAYPHCTKIIENFHHTVPFAFNRSHEKVIGLCKVHHELCHNGVVKNELKDPENWKLDLEPHKSIYDDLYLKYKMKLA